jgi:hypothetical protein
VSPSLTISGDSRRVLVPSLGIAASRTDSWRTRYEAVRPGIALNLSTQLQTSVGAELSRNRDNTQWYGNFTDSAGTTHYTVGRLEQRTLALTTRASYAATPNLTLELYAAPFVSTGSYSTIRELSTTPRAASYDDRFAHYTPPPGSPAGFDVRQLRSNLIARWEYRPGSTLYVVWTHGRDGRDDSSIERPWDAEYRSLFALHPDNTFLIKAAYWLSR